MDRKQKDTLKHFLPKLVEEVNPRQLLTYLPCLSTYSQEEIETAQFSQSRSLAAQKLHSHLIRRPEGFDQLLCALRQPEVNRNDLADDLVQHLGNITGGHRFGRPSSPRHDNVLWNGSTPSRQSVLPGATGYGTRLQSPTNWNSHSPPAAQQLRPPYTTGRPQQPPLSVNTLWRELPAGVLNVLKMFDVGNSIKNPNDLAELLGFTIEESALIRTQVPSGESFTVAIIERWAKSKNVTLGDIYRIFKELDRKDILDELQKRTGVKFERSEERQVSQRANEYQQAEVGSSVGNEAVIYNRTDPNINNPTEKPIEYRKSVLNTGSEESRVNRHTSAGLQQNRSNHIQNDNRIQVQPISYDRSLEGDGRKSPDIKDTFSGYKPEEIITNMTDDTPVQPDMNIQLEDRAKYPKKSEEHNPGDVSKNIESIEINGSGGFPVNLTNQDGPERNVNIYKNDLDRSNSSCSSNTENSAYDSMTDVGQLNDDFNSCGQEKSRNEDSNEGTSKTVSEELSSDSKQKNIGSKQNSSDQKSTLPEAMLEVDFAENCRNKSSNLHTFASSRNLSDEKIAEAEFERRVLEDKLKHGVTGNYSDFLSQSDQASRVSSLSMTTRLAENQTKETAMRSIENYEDYSLEDGKIIVPKLSIGSAEMKSIERKAAKPFPGYEKVMETTSTQFIDGYQENPDSSFQIDWNFSDGEIVCVCSEQDGQRNETSDSIPARMSDGNPFGQSDSGFLNKAEHAREDEEFTRRGGIENLLEVSENIKSGEVSDDSVAKRQNVAVGGTVAVDTVTLGHEQVECEKRESEEVRQGNEHIVENIDSEISRNGVIANRNSELVSHRNGHAGSRKSETDVQVTEHVLVAKRNSGVLGQGNEHVVAENKESEAGVQGNEHVLVENRESNAYGQGNEYAVIENKESEAQCQGNEHLVVENRESEIVNHGNEHLVVENREFEIVNHGNEHLVVENRESEIVNESQVDARQGHFSFKDLFENALRITKMVYDNQL